MKLLGSLVYLVPVVVVLFEYVAVSSALAYARYLVEYNQPVVSLLGGLVRVGDNLAYDAVPNAVVTLHLLGLLLSVIYLIYFFILPLSTKQDETPVPPQEG